MNVVIVEDESLSAQRLEILLKENDPSIQVIALLPSVDESLQWFRDPTLAVQTDLVFMDIHLEDGNAFHIIEKVNLRIPIIFTTAYNSYAIQAFKANSIDYLLKPIEESELAAAIDKFKWLKQKPEPVMARQINWSTLLKWEENPGSVAYKDRFMVTVGTRIKSVDVSQIAYFFYDEKTTFLTTKDGQNLVVEYSLDKLGSVLNPHQFFRVNRSYLVALSALKSIHTFSTSKLKLELQPTPRHEIFVSSNRLSDFKTWLGK